MRIAHRRPISKVTNGEAPRRSCGRCVAFWEGSAIAYLAAAAFVLIGRQLFSDESTIRSRRHRRGDLLRDLRRDCSDPPDLGRSGQRPGTRCRNDRSSRHPGADSTAGSRASLRRTGCADLAAGVAGRAVVWVRGVARRRIRDRRLSLPSARRARASPFRRSGRCTRRPIGEWFRHAGSRSRRPRLSSRRSTPAGLHVRLGGDTLSIPSDRDSAERARSEAPAARPSRPARFHRSTALGDAASMGGDSAGAAAVFAAALARSLSFVCSAKRSSTHGTIVASSVPPAFAILLSESTRSHAESRSLYRRKHRCVRALRRVPVHPLGATGTSARSRTRRTGFCADRAGGSAALRRRRLLLLQDRARRRSGPSESSTRRHPSAAPGPGRDPTDRRCRALASPLFVHLCRSSRGVLAGVLAPGARAPTRVDSAAAALSGGQPDQLLRCLGAAARPVPRLAVRPPRGARAESASDLDLRRRTGTLAASSASAGLRAGGVSESRRTLERRFPSRNRSHLDPRMERSCRGLCGLGALARHLDPDRRHRLRTLAGRARCGGPLHPARHPVAKSLAGGGRGVGDSGGAEPCPPMVAGSRGGRAPTVVAGLSAAAGRGCRGRA